MTELRSVTCHMGSHSVTCHPTPFLFEGLTWGEDFFARLPIPTAVYMTFFPNDETQILFSGFDDTPPILYHGLELTNIDLLSTLPWLNINNLRYK